MADERHVERPDQSCANCRWARIVSATAEDGTLAECHFNPPVVVPGVHWGVFPGVTDGDWCRQWTPPYEGRGTMLRGDPDVQSGMMGRVVPTDGTDYTRATTPGARGKLEA